MVSSKMNGTVDVLFMISTNLGFLFFSAASQKPFTEYLQGVKKISPRFLRILREPLQKAGHFIILQKKKRLLSSR